MAVLKMPVTSSDHIQGDAHAPVTLVEYGDYECPYCGAAHPHVQLVQKHYGRQLRFVFRHFPLTEVHPNAQSAAESAEFAGAHGRFWEMHDLLFENQERLGIPLLFAAVRSLGLSETELRDALAEGTYTPKVRDDFLGGVRSGVNGTPAFFINDRRHDGPFDFPHLVAAIDTQF
ncbi:DsbA family protein [Azospirillum brasilense]|uniref:DsbA family protein n=1 Tax=Azospirillum brasilense TaxID=192 RepID=UPI001ED9E90D|nr:DsbA family protein [Azospirillum brasilense]UKJ76494.1 thioredoxin domain-containing protein [Azospirillum brasilense]